MYKYNNLYSQTRVQVQ